MEGFTNSKNVSNYEMLSKYYDELLQDEESLSLWLKYIESEKFKDVLELASGSGVMAGLLTNKGYNVIASDISIDMKNASINNYSGEYLILNMANYNLDRKFDLILCICDSINYLEESELSGFMKCAYNHLNDHGRLIFDAHNILRIQEFKNEYIEEGFLNDIGYQWTINSDVIDKQINEHFTFYTKDGMIQEHHTQNVFNKDVLVKNMKPYFDIKIIEDFVPDEKLLFIGKKK